MIHFPSLISLRSRLYLAGAKKNEEKRNIADVAVLRDLHNPKGRRKKEGNKGKHGAEGKKLERKESNRRHATRSIFADRVPGENVRSDDFVSTMHVSSKPDGARNKMKKEKQKSGQRVFNLSAGTS